MENVLGFLFIGILAAVIIGSVITGIRYTIKYLRKKDFGFACVLAILTSLPLTTIILFVHYMITEVM